MELIEIGNPLLIFSEDYSLIETFSNLLKFQLIDIKKGRVVLTRKGEAARTIGFNQALANLKEEELKDISNLNKTRDARLISFF